MAAYPELQSGRFAVIADFEDPKHMEIIQLIGVSPGARCVLSPRRGRAETGSGCLQFTAGSSDDMIVINNDRAVNWYLKRDWRDYDLLLVSMKSPRRGLSADVSISAGPSGQPTAVRSVLRLERGWNLLSLDLAEVGERIPLDEVRELRFSISGVTKPAKINIDDIILAGSRQELLGASDGSDGALYVQRAGRRWNIGAGGRFEFTFANGQIVRWHNLKADPYRVRNLVEGTTLGPTPIVADSDVGAAGDTSSDPFGDRVVARMRILEMNSVRVVVECEWRFVDASYTSDAPLDHRPLHRWRYTIYPTGQVYVATKCSDAPTATSVSHLGLAVVLAAGRYGDVDAHLGGALVAHPERRPLSGMQRRPRDNSLLPTGVVEEATPDGSRTPLYASARIREAQAFLLYVPGEQQRLRTLTERHYSSRRRVSFTAVWGNGVPNGSSWYTHLLVLSSADISDEEVRARAAAYSRPARLRFELGSPVRCDHADTGETGFDPASGCYVISPEHGHVRFVVGGAGQALFSPAFQVGCRPDQKAWVYVNNLVFDSVARDADGNLIFQIPGTIRDETMVEILFRQQERASR
ncbi:MAG: hypothetical protein ACE5HE_05200 [Phycisphaerae bacterium]